MTTSRLQLIRNITSIMNNIQTFVFLDLETTGLPYLENNKTKITELSMVAVQKEHISLGVFQRVQNKLSMCFNPLKLISSEAEDITGLSNDVLENFGSFSAKTIESVNLFLEHHPQPTCLVAHNGDRFDYPIFQAAIKKTGSKLIDVLCIDSLAMFRDLQREDLLKENSVTEDIISNTEMVTFESHNIIKDGCYENHDMSVMRALEIQKINETTPKNKRNICEIDSGLELVDKVDGDGTAKKKIKVITSRKKLNFGGSFKLVDIYERVTKTKAINAHRAECDTNMLLLCSASLGDRFINWANTHARNFNEIPPMTPGRKLGQ